MMSDRYLMIRKALLGQEMIVVFTTLTGYTALYGRLDQVNYKTSLNRSYVDVPLKRQEPHQ